MDIKVLGTGCNKCNMLANVTREAVRQSGIDASVTKVEDLVEIMQYGVMTTPVLVVNGEIVTRGNVPSVNEIVQILQSKQRI
jgi:small redox-active disulfide protein 2